MTTTKTPSPQKDNVGLATAGLILATLSLIIPICMLLFVRSGAGQSIFYLEFSLQPLLTLVALILTIVSIVKSKGQARIVGYISLLVLFAVFVLFFMSLSKIVI